MRFGVLVLVLVVGCGRLHFDSRGDAAADTTAAGDAACVLGPFSAPVHVPELESVAAEYAATMTADNLTVFFDSQRAGGAGAYDIWTATRPDEQSPFATPTNVAELNTASDDDDPSISADGLTIYFGSTRSGTLQVWSAQRPDVGAPFGTPTLVTGMLSTVAAGAPDISFDQDTIYYELNGDVWSTARATPKSPTGALMTVAGVDTTTHNELNPSISTDELEFFFATDASGSFDVARTTRPSLPATWATPVLVPGLDTPLHESDPNISYDGRILWVGIVGASDSTGGADLYYLTRSCQ